MRPPNETSPAGEQGTLYESVTRPTTPKPSRPTQYDRVLRVLMENDEVCGHRTFYAEMMIPRFGAHLHRMRKQGYVWSKRPCDRHEHEGTAYLYRLVALPDEPLTLMGRGNV